MARLKHYQQFNMMRG